MKFQASVQILLIIIDVVVVVTVVRPKFAEIQTNQQEIQRFGNAVEKATQFNQKLQELIDRADGISSLDMIRLNSFLPERIDSVRVSRDVQNIAKTNGLLLENISSSASDGGAVTTSDTIGANGEQLNSQSISSEAERDLVIQQFELEVIGSYENLKNMLRDIERNAYPLRLVELTLAAEEESLLHAYEMTLETYALPDSN